MGCIHEITGHTKLTGLLGSPVAHSISPLMHNESFKMLGLDYVYLCFDVPEDNLETVFNGLKKLNIAGFNCTMPDKTRICQLVDELSPAASMIGAVNTVVNDNGKFIGHNTDGIGYMQSVKDAGYDITGSTMTLLGAGGAASSIFVQAALDGVKNINIFSIKDRFWEKAERMVEAVNKNTDCTARLMELGDDALLADSIADSQILTNATSVGMAPNVDGCIVSDNSMLPEGLIVSDVIYNPMETKLLKMAKERGCKTFNGMYMLLYQGAEAFKIWTGREMPVEHIKNCISIKISNSKIHFEAKTVSVSAHIENSSRHFFITNNELLKCTETDTAFLIINYYFSFFVFFSMPTAQTFQEYALRQSEFLLWDVSFQA